MDSCSLGMLKIKVPHWRVFSVLQPQPRRILIPASGYQYPPGSGRMLTITVYTRLYCEVPGYISHPIGSLQWYIPDIPSAVHNASLGPWASIVNSFGVSGISGTASEPIG